MLSPVTFRTTIAAMKHILAFLGAVVLLTGCFDSDAEIRVDDDGSGRIDLEYRIDKELFRLGVFDDSDLALPIPVSRADFERAADNVDGLRLRRYRVREEAGLVTVEARLSFESVEALSHWYGAEGSISLRESSGRTVWTQLLAPGSVDSTVAEAIARSLEGYTVRYVLRPPSRVIGSSLGEITEDGRASEVELTLSELATTEGPVIWSVEWE